MPLPEPDRENEKEPEDERLRLLSKELEEAASEFLRKFDQLEKLLPLIEE
jgi:hypothetical protein